MPYLDYYAGSAALSALRENGLVPGRLWGMLGPATGPRWLGWAELDRAVARCSLLAKRSDGSRMVLRGGSAGAWRMAALACPDPLRKHRALAERYIDTEPRAEQSPLELSALYRELLEQLFSDDSARMLAHPSCELQVVVARVAPFLQRTNGWAKLALGTVALLSACMPHRTPPFMEQLALGSANTQNTCAINPSSLVSALLASGSVPGYMAPVSIPDADNARCLDGGLVEYHVGHNTLTAGPVLMIHHTNRLKARWFDKLIPWAPAPLASMQHLLLLVPTRAYLNTLPYHVLPTRDDFLRYSQSQSHRIRRWQECVARSELLAEEFEGDLVSGRLIEKLQPLGPRQAIPCEGLTETDPRRGSTT